MAKVQEISFDVYTSEVLEQLEDEDIVDYVKEHKLLEIKRPETSITEQELVQFLYVWAKATHNIHTTLTAQDMKEKLCEMIDFNWELIKRE